MAERAQPQRAQDKLAFLLSLVPYLIDRDRVSVSEVAEHFGVPEQQIRDAVQLLAVSGIPGETNTYQHGDLFDIAWDSFEDNDEIVITNLVAIDDSPRFSAREAAALIAGLQYLSSLPEQADRAAIASLMSKLSRGASAEPSAVAVASSETDSTLQLARESVERGLQLEFTYVDSRGEFESRKVDPLRVESVDSDWYLRGWCHLREAVRTFRIDRISDPRITNEPITHEPGDVTLPDKLFEGSSDDLGVTIEVASGAVPLLADYSPEVLGESVDDRVRVGLRVSHYHGLKRLVAGMPGGAIVLEPAEARAVVRDWAATAAARYGG
ncbi:proteasome accessory factor C [Microbacteriaceae bacterium SG_E_30_P1]|uniref:Proteasome accessory factor C n=1 Tax=Antiquaquibacter oligotrophicus TaxID=2880260 RepID=A0ABT6KMB0_9MICO|nr:WYL domain-containing protein [Antiquaquibacter oligotrophicus]MDH6180865.1 proteasome accessory factor C [Antiquaquibacter oligotrophicus]UDF13422.1 WYL domain-containing protein [Antiquaquibacter oligotrophicus]